MDDDGPKYNVTKLDGTPVHDAVVIRLKDPFAPTALYTYANTIMSGLEVWGDYWSEAERDRMIELADYFHNQALISEQVRDKRLPD
jgi:hypothetical protein